MHRIGLSEVIPDCPVHQSYIVRQNWFQRWLYSKPHAVLDKYGKPVQQMVNLTFRCMSKLNSLWYRIHLISHYQNTKLFMPLPFDRCFYQTALAYDFDLIFAHDLTALPAAVKIADERSVPLVYDAHELYYEQKVFSKKQKRFMRKIEASLIHKCQLAFTVNDSIADEMAKRYDCEKPKVLLNVIDPPGDFDSTKKDKKFHRFFDLSENSLILLFQGGLLPNRNLENLVKAMSQVNNENIVLVIMGDGSLKTKLINLVIRYNLEQNVLFKNAVPQRELVEWTASADCGIIPYTHVDLNTYYCTPNKLFEYIQAGLPIIANNLPELKRYVEGCGFGLNIEMNTEKAIAKGIDRLCNDPSQLINIKETIVNKKDTFTWAAAQKDYLNIIENLTPI